MAKSSERFALKNLGESLHLKGNLKNYVGHSKNNNFKQDDNPDKTCWNNLIDKTEKDIKFYGYKKKVNVQKDSVKELIKENLVQSIFLN